MSTPREGLLVNGSDSFECDNVAEAVASPAVSVSCRACVTR
jgi:hypothetical protein